MAEVAYKPDDFGWFPLSRRLVASSIWFGPAETLKVLIYMIERATNPMNPYPGDVIGCGEPLARSIGITEAELDQALNVLCGPDEASHSQANAGARLEPLTISGKVIGYRLINFGDYNDGAIERGAVKRKLRATERAKKAAQARWHPKQDSATKYMCDALIDGQRCDQPAANAMTGNVYCDVCITRLRPTY
jgi:hypothetical protein